MRELRTSGSVGALGSDPQGDPANPGNGPGHRALDCDTLEEEEPLHLGDTAAAYAAFRSGRRRNPWSQYHSWASRSDSRTERAV